MITSNPLGLAVLFGYGTVSVGTTIPDGKLQYIQLEGLKEKMEIGSKIESIDKVESSKRILLIFDKPESVDVLISSLQEIKRNLTPIRQIPEQEHDSESCMN